VLSLSPDDVRRFSRTILLRPVGGRGQSRLLESRVLAEGSGATLEAFLLFARRAGLGLVEVGPADLVVFAGRRPGPSPDDLGRTAVVALEGQAGVAVVSLEEGEEPGPGERLRAAALAAGRPRAAHGALALAAGAHLANLALRRRLEPRFDPAAPAIALFRCDDPLPSVLPLRVPDRGRE